MGVFGMHMVMSVVMRMAVPMIVSMEVGLPIAMVVPMSMILTVPDMPDWQWLGRLRFDQPA